MIQKRRIMLTDEQYEELLLNGTISVEIDGKIITVNYDESDEYDTPLPNTPSSNDLWEKGTGINSIKNKNAPGDASGQYALNTGFQCYSRGDYSTTRGFQTHAGPSGSGVILGWAEGYAADGSGYMTSALGDKSHTEGDNTITNNPSEHAEGRFNKSNMNSQNYGDPLNTQHSVGIGHAGEHGQFDTHMNAFEIMQNGDAYVIGIGGYDGTNPDSANTLQAVINNMDVHGDVIDLGTLTSLSDLDVILNSGIYKYKYNTPVTEEYMIVTKTTINDIISQSRQVIIGAPPRCRYQYTLDDEIVWSDWCEILTSKHINNPDTPDKQLITSEYLVNNYLPIHIKKVIQVYEKDTWYDVGKLINFVYGKYLLNVNITHRASSEPPDSHAWCPSELNTDIHLKFYNNGYDFIRVVNSEDTAQDEEGYGYKAKTGEIAIKVKSTRSTLPATSHTIAIDLLFIPISAKELIPI